MSMDEHRVRPDAFSVGTIYDGTNPEAVEGLGQSMTDYLANSACECHALCVCRVLEHEEER